MEQIELPAVLRDLMKMKPDEVRGALAQVQALMAQLDTFESLLMMVADLAQGDGSNGAEPERIPQPRTLREAVIAIMSDGKLWKPAEVLHALTDHGWAPNGSAARSQVSNRLRDMLKREEVTQAADGRYRLALSAKNDESE
jgi:hypothetical protein